MKKTASIFRRMSAGLVALTLLFIPAVIGEIASDEFNGDDFAASWEWAREPDNWSLDDGKLTMETATDANLWASNDAHFLFQESTGDFDVETQFDAEWETASMVLGLVAQSPTDDNWVTLKLWGRDGDSVIQYQAKQEALGPDTEGQPVGEHSLYFRLKREGDTYTSFTKENEGDAWTEYAVTDRVLTEPIQVGIYAGVADPAGTLTASFDFVRDALGPADPTAVEPNGKLATAWGALKKQTR